MPALALAQGEVPVSRIRLDEFPKDAFIRRSEKAIILTREIFDQLSDYSRSQPTAPSVGRVYKKNLGWPTDMPDNWYYYECIRDPDDPKYVLHVPRKIIIAELEPVQP